MIQCPLRVLVVDDNALFQRLLVRWIVEMGHDVVGVPDALSALEAMRERKVHVVVSDLMMPGMDGMELCRHLRKEQEQSGLYFLLVTADATRERLHEAWEAGVDDVLSKPVSREDLEARLRTACRLHRLEAEVKRRTRLHDERERLALALKEHERLLGIIAHELRTPLGGMRMVSDILTLRKEELPPALHKVVGMLQTQVLTMVGTLENLLESSVRSDRGGGLWDACDAAMLCREAMALVEHQVKDGTVLEMMLPTPLPMFADPDRIRRLAVNLLNNAIRHAGGRTVRLSGKMMAEDQIELCIQDNGEGISPRVLAVLGEPLLLNSGNLDEERKARGSGLGLAVCKQIVARHSGALIVESSLGIGTRIRVQLRTNLDKPSVVSAEGGLYAGSLPCQRSDDVGQCHNCLEDCLFRRRVSE